MNVVNDGNDGDNDHENNEDDYKEYDQYVDVNVVVDDNDVDGDAAQSIRHPFSRQNVYFRIVPHGTSSYFV